MWYDMPMKRLVLLVFLASSEVIQSSPPLSITFLEDEDYYNSLRKEIRQSREEIDVAMFLFRTRGSPANRANILAGELIKAVQRGVRVRVILEKSADPLDTVTADNRETAVKLRGGGVEVSFDSLRKRSHAKVIVVDSRLTFIGSHNLTEAALKNNNEASVLIESPEVAIRTRQFIFRVRGEGSQ